MEPMDPTAGTTEEVPTRYRLILALVAELERAGGRREANGIRKSALAAYGGAWDDRQRRRLEELELHLRRSIAAHGQSSGRPARHR
jgi:hypothetical protein